MHPVTSSVLVSQLNDKIVAFQVNEIKRNYLSRTIKHSLPTITSSSELGGGVTEEDAEKLENYERDPILVLFLKTVLSNEI